MNYPVGTLTYPIELFMQNRSDEIKFVRGFAWKKKEKDFRVYRPLSVPNNERQHCVAFVAFRCIGETFLSRMDFDRSV